MFYAWDITVPAATPESAPVTQILKLTKGVITGVWIKFPPGCHSLVKVRILRSEFHLVPLSRGEWVTGDDETVVTETFYDLDVTPAQLKFVACSPGTTYPHTITVRVGLVPEEVAAPHRVLAGFVETLKRFVGL